MKFTLKLKEFNNFLYKLIIVFFILSLVFANNMIFASSTNLSYPAELLTNNSDLEIYADGCILLDVDSGKVLYNKNGIEKMYPASTTKMVTGLLVLEKCNLNDMVNVSYYAVHSVPATYSIANLMPGESLSVKDLLYALMIGSANDAAFVLAEYIANGGNNYLTDSSDEAKSKFSESIQKFSDMMNEKAKEFGCSNTHFVNPNGIQNESHYSTAYDLALIGKNVYKNEQLMNVVNVLSYSLPNTDIYTGETRTCNCTNPLLYKDREYYFPYANGIKTGYTDPAGYCIVASAKKDNVNLIAVILNSKVASYVQTEENKNTSREADCLRLFQYGFDNYSYQNLISNGNVATTIKVLNGDYNSKSLDLIVKDDVSALVKKGDSFNITPDIKISKFLAPIAKGEIIGTITYNFNGKTYSSDLIASHDVIDSDYTNLILGLLGTFLVLLFFVVLINKKDRKKK